MVRPIDLQDNLAKTQMVERMNQIEKAHGEVGQKVVADALKEQAAAKLERTQAAEEKDMVIIRDDEEKGKQDQQKKKKQKNDEDDNLDSPVEHLDIKA